jgi:hypothetical protein
VPQAVVFLLYVRVRHAGHARPLLRQAQVVRSAAV